MQREVLPRFDIGGLKGVKPRELAVRFALGAIVAVLAGMASALVGSRFAGLFLAFPAILPATLTFIQEHEGTRRADRDAIGSVLGGLALVAFAVVGESLFTRDNSALVLVLALLGWFVAVGVFYSALAWLRPEDCDVNMD